MAEPWGSAGHSLWKIPLPPATLCTLASRSGTASTLRIRIAIAQPEEQCLAICRALLEDTHNALAAAIIATRDPGARLLDRASWPGCQHLVQRAKLLQPLLGAINHLAQIGGHVPEQGQPNHVLSNTHKAHRLFGAGLKGLVPLLLECVYGLPAQVQQASGRMPERIDASRIGIMADDLRQLDQRLLALAGMIRSEPASGGSPVDFDEISREVTAGVELAPGRGPLVAAVADMLLRLDQVCARAGEGREFWGTNALFILRGDTLARLAGRTGPDPAPGWGDAFLSSRLSARRPEPGIGIRHNVNSSGLVPVHFRETCNDPALLAAIDLIDPLSDLGESFFGDRLEEASGPFWGQIAELYRDILNSFARDNLDVAGAFERFFAVAAQIIADHEAAALWDVILDNRLLAGTPARPRRRSEDLPPWDPG